MKKSVREKLLKLLTGLAVGIFVLAMFAPQTVSAQSLGFLGGDIRPSINETFSITVTTSNSQSGVLVRLQILNAQKNSPITWVRVNPSLQECRTGQNGSCSFDLTPTQAGSFHLAATVIGGGYQSISTQSPIVVANGLTLSATPSTVNTGQNSVITATTSDRKANVIITFSGPTVGLSDSTCTTTTSGSCSVTFSSKSQGIFPIVATAPGYSTPGPNVGVNVGGVSATRSSLITPVGGITGSVKQAIQIPVRTSDNRKDVRVSFSIQGIDVPEISFSPASCSLGRAASCSECTTDSSGSCSVSLTASKAGNFAIVVRTPFANPSYGTDTIPLTITQSTTSGGISTSNYQLLVPLPDATGELKNINVSGNNALGQYLNTIIRLIIGLAAVLAVVKIVIAGIQYITSELPGVKGEAKGSIMNAIIGLLVALGAWVIINTVNPAALNTNVQIAQTTIQFESEEEILPTSNLFDLGSPPSGGVNLCPEGVSKINASGVIFNVCNKIASNVQAMVALAKSQGINLDGWGWRSQSQQIQLRIRHCGGNTQYNVYQKPSSQCLPPTARPGASRHESGLAIDFKCDGVVVQTRDNKCFLWLNQNAGKFGLFNLSSEPWHWSFDGN